jgi:molybdate-binding protein
MAAPVRFLPAYLPQTDGIISKSSARHVSVRPALDLRRDRPQLLLAGCDPALSLLAQTLERSGIEILSVPCSSRRALDWLNKGRVHAAGSHLLDSTTGDYNVPFIKRLFPTGAVRVVTFAVWEQGLVVARGNPKCIRTAADLARKGVTLINREKGSGSRDVLNKALRRADIAANSVAGYERLATGHLSAAYAVSSGEADCCIATRSAARCFGLDFIPFASERFDLSFSKASAELPAAKALFDLLTHSIFRGKLQAIAGYDTAHTGDVLL